MPLDFGGKPLNSNFKKLCLRSGLISKHPNTFGKPGAQGVVSMEKVTKRGERHVPSTIKPHKSGPTTPGSRLDTQGRAGDTEQNTDCLYFTFQWAKLACGEGSEQKGKSFGNTRYRTDRTDLTQHLMQTEPPQIEQKAGNKRAKKGQPRLFLGCEFSGFTRARW